METKSLKVRADEARRIYKEVPSLRISLEATFGKNFFSESIFDRIKSYEDCCIEIGEEPVDVDSMLQKGFTMDEIVYRKLKQITRAINEEHIPDMLNTFEYKWKPWFKVSSSAPSGFVFGFSYYDFSYARAGDASRLCFKDEKRSDFAGKLFLDLYVQFIK